MTVNVGVIGVGMIGKDHIRRFTHVLSGARSSPSPTSTSTGRRSRSGGLPRAKCIRPVRNSSTPRGRRHRRRLLGTTHEEYVLASIAAGKQVFCEKPLATTQEACERILDAEVARQAAGQVGFMRRYDTATGR